MMEFDDFNDQVEDEEMDELIIDEEQLIMNSNSGVNCDLVKDAMKKQKLI